jgi:hypothetical protein
MAFWIAACDPAPQAAPDASEPADARPDASLIREHVVPVSVSGSTPLGTLEAFTFAEAYYNYCFDDYVIDFRTTNLYDQEPYIEIVIPLSETTVQPVLGPLPASASAYRWDQQRGWTSLGWTDQVTFDAQPLDPPSLPSARIAGTVSTTVPGWTLGFHVDLTFYLAFVNHGGCTL